MRLRRSAGVLVAVAGGLAALAAGTATAATPPAGTLSAAAPRIEWEGEVAFSGAFYNAWDVDRELRCAGPACDPFALTLAEPADLFVVGLNVGSSTATGEEGSGGLRIVRPDGATVWVKGESGPDTTLRVQIPDASPGTYEVTAVASYVCCGPSGYEAYAELPAPGSLPPAQPEPGPGVPPDREGGGASRGATLSIVTRRARAGRVKARRRLRVRLHSTGPLTDLRARLVRGRRTLGRGTRAELNGSGRVVLRFSRKRARRVRAGRHGLTVAGLDAYGRTVGASVRFRMR